MTIMVGRVTYGTLRYDPNARLWRSSMHMVFYALGKADQDVIKVVVKEYQDMCTVTRRLFS